ncbi:MAG: hypothetical protein A4E36_02113 [Methanoregulaceae archaeon PtaB.Bin009]|nr:MAG: hypothetical protein A4E36_02113 [Methanoregulaceae archaeon PtaB.Bin009]OPY39894.1 MAG: hypothetical protein A4E41_01574 [Methanoregulaceae archaeon PtaU1.Bin066]
MFVSASFRPLLSAVRCSSIPPRSQHEPVHSRLTRNDDAPGFVVPPLAGSCSIPLLAPCFAACSSLCSVKPLTLSDSLPSVPRAAVDTHSPALASRRGIGKYPPLSAPSGPGSSSPSGEAVIRISPFRQGGHRAAARKHPVPSRSEVAVLTSVRGPRCRKWGGEGLLGTSGSESWRPWREAAGGSA